MKHKHCDAIKAWADGAEIEVLIYGYPKSRWALDTYPTWDKDTHYRVKTSKTIEELKKVMDDAWWAYELDETLWDMARDAQDAYEVALTER